MVTTLGRVLGTRLGTLLDDFTKEQWRALAFTLDTTKMYALTGFTPADYYRTGVGGGEIGDAAGFGGATAFQLVALPTLGTVACLQANHASATATWSWALINSGGNVSMRLEITNGAGTVVNGPLQPITASDVGKVMVAAFQHTGTQLVCYLNRVKYNAAVAITGLAPATGGRHSLGARADDARALGNNAELSSITWRGTPSDAQVTALFDAARTAGDLPQKAAVDALITPATVTHRWCLRDVLVAANSQVLEGQAAPATIADSVTAAPVDAMARTGSPTLKIIDPATPKLWSYETTPLLYGAQSLAVANHYETPVNGIPGDASGFAISIFGIFTALTASRKLAAQRNGNPGWEINAGTTTMSFAMGNASAGGSAPTMAISATDLGKMHVFTGVWDAANTMIRAYARRAQLGSGSSLPTGYAPATTVKTTLGRGTFSGDGSGFVMLGFFYGVGVPTLAQIQQHYDDCLAAESMRPIPGMTGTYVNFDLDIRANANALPAALTDRGTGGVTFTRVGTPTVASQYARAFGW